MNKFGLNAAQELALVVLLEDGEIDRQQHSNFRGRSGREIKFSTMVALHDKGLVTVALTKRRPGLPPKFTALLSPVGDRLARDLRNAIRATARERSGRTIEGALS